MRSVLHFKNKYFTIAVIVFFSQFASALKIYRIGNSHNVSPTTEPMVCLAGGGEDDYWSDGWKEMINRANGGDVVVIRADDDREEYESWIFDDTARHGFRKVNSVSTIILSNEADSSSKELISLIDHAEMIFFAGGDQYKYYRFIHGTKLEAALNRALKERKIPMAGTSAGMAILGDIDYIAQVDTQSDPISNVSAKDVLINPTGLFVTLDRGFLTPNYLDKVVTDTHFSQRNRQGRLIGFMARATYNNYSDVNASNIKGIGADEGTAVCINDNGIAKIYGTNSVHFLLGNHPIERLQSGSSLNWYGNKLAIKVYSISGLNSDTAEFDFKTWSGVGGQSKYWYIDGTYVDQPFFGEKDLTTNEK